jgi:hypothetical protein
MFLIYAPGYCDESFLIHTVVTEMKDHRAPKPTLPDSFGALPDFSFVLLNP